jgi:drug/metabolite transporter (DMT)-like permease
VKLAASELPNAMVVFLRNLLGLAAVLPWLLRQGGGLRTSAWKGHLVRGLFGLGSMYCYFAALAHLRLADAVLLYQSMPLFIPLVERVWEREPWPPGLWSALGLGFAGLLLILRPGTGLFSPFALVGLMAAVFAAVAQVGVRRLTRTEPVTRIVFFFAAVATLGSAPPAAAQWRTPDLALWPILLALGGSATLGQLAMTRAYAHAPASRVGPVLYTGPIFAAVFDWLLWRRLPDLVFLAGAAMVAAAATLALRRPRARAEPPAA